MSHPCQMWKLGGLCDRGDKCPYLHEKKPQHKRPASSGASSRDAGGPHRWEWKDDSGWKAYADDVSAQIERAFADKRGYTTLTKGFFATHNGYTVKFDLMIQRNLAKCTQRPVRRVRVRVPEAAAAASSHSSSDSISNNGSAFLSPHADGGSDGSGPAPKKRRVDASPSKMEGSFNLASPSSSSSHSAASANGVSGNSSSSSSSSSSNSSSKARKNGTTAATAPRGHSERGGGVSSRTRSAGHLDLEDRNESAAEGGDDVDATSDGDGGGDVDSADEKVALDAMIDEYVRPVQASSSGGLHGIRPFRFNITPTCKLVVCEGNIGTFRPQDADNASSDNAPSSTSSSSSPSNGSKQHEKFAVVNAANAGLWAGSGVCGAIFSAAGHFPLKQACIKARKQFAERRGRKPKCGDAIETPAFKMANNGGPKMIIHAIAPNLNSGEDIRRLGNAYFGSLQIAEAQQMSSVVFPSLGTGIFGCDIKSSAQLFLKALRMYFQKNKASTIKRVYMILFNPHNADEVRKYRKTYVASAHQYLEGPFSSFYKDK